MNAIYMVHIMLDKKRLGTAAALTLTGMMLAAYGARDTSLQNRIAAYVPNSRQIIIELMAARRDRGGRLMLTVPAPEAIVIPPEEPGRLNLAYLYPEGADRSDVFNSYAGMLYRKLATLEGQWISALYRLDDQEPAMLAQSLGRPAASVLGGYNPEDPSHNIDDPNSWFIHTYQNVHVTFRDGDGRYLSRPAKAKDILAMTSVYAYYNQIRDYKSLEDYAVRLWKKTGTYSVSMGSVYQCDGRCVKDALADSALADKAGPDQTAGSKAADQASTLGQSGAVPVQTDGQSAAAAGEAGDPAGDPNMAVAFGVTDYLLPSEGAATDSADASDRQGMPTETKARHKIGPGRATIYPDGYVNAGPGIESSPEDSAPAAQELTWDGGQTVGSGGAQSAQPAEAAPIPEEGSHSAVPTGVAGITPESSEQLAQLRDQKLRCPGHVDLNISVRILGLDEKHGLASADAIGNRKELIAEGKWPGWNQETLGYARSLTERDWYEDYGLSISAISTASVLSDKEIEAYMDLLPRGLSQERKTLIRFALSSVGKVPYYWGGKPIHAGYDKNQFGSVVTPDESGRMFCGLDCSGWVAWVYWSALGKHLSAQSTGMLANAGRRTTRAQLVPGDIIVKIGETSHVVMFLGWADNGQMLCIHETGGIANNVVVGTMTANWPYYRKLVD